MDRVSNRRRLGGADEPADEEEVPHMSCLLTGEKKAVFGGGRGLRVDFEAETAGGPARPLAGYRYLVSSMPMRESRPS